MRAAVLFLAVFAAPLLTGSCSRTSGTERPNVIFILADDLGLGDLACYDNHYIETPVIDRLAGRGIRLANCYAASPLCAPSRGAILTGRYNHRTGAIDVSSNRGIDRIALSEKTMGDYFRNAGYTTALIGKWHSGCYNIDYLPNNRGFDIFYGFPNGWVDYYHWNLLRNGVNEKYDGRYLTDVINMEAIRFIESSKDKPFFLYISHLAPHMPYDAPDSLVQKYQARINGSYHEDVARIYAMIESMDTGLGWVFEKLDQLGLSRKTVIVFTSDNGGYVLGTSDRFKAGLSGNKGDVLEEGIRVPGIVAWPGKIKPGITLDTPVSGIDWLPTLFSVTDCEAPEGARPLDGENLMPVFLQEKVVAPSDRTLFFQKNRYTPVAHSDGAVKWGKWKLFWPGVPETMAKDNIRDGLPLDKGKFQEHWEMPIDYTLPGYEDVVTGPPMLFNLEEDPSEQQNVSVIYPEIADSMRILYDRWFESVDADWKRAFEEIIEYDRAYWKNRQVPDPLVLYKDFWDWEKVKTDPAGTDPLKVFRGYWDYAWNEYP